MHTRNSKGDGSVWSTKTNLLMINLLSKNWKKLIYWTCEVNRVENWDKLPHYQHSRNRYDAAAINHKFLDYNHKCRAHRYGIYYQDWSRIFKNMAFIRFWNDIQGYAGAWVERSIKSCIGYAENGLLYGSLILLGVSKSNKWCSLSHRNEPERVRKLHRIERSPVYLHHHYIVGCCTEE